jgi:LytTr DNA-binding domain
MDGLVTNDPGPRVGRRQDGYDRRRSGTSGDVTRTSGGRLAALARGYLAVAVFIVLISSVNVLSLLDEAARDGGALPTWIPISKELSSAVGGLLACSLVYLAMRLAAPARVGWLRAALVQALGTIAFSAVHQAVMTELRIVIFAAHGASYHRPPLPADLVYEYRKDLVAYIVMAALFWMFRPPRPRPTAEEAARQPNGTPPPEEASFDIIDGAKTLRVPVGRILAVRAARNYVEFLLEDGRTPLMRASMVNVESALTSRGLVRTHRSWLVNPNRLRSLEATGSGDYRIGLDGDVQVPLSRRFPAALDRLRRVGAA